VWDSRGRRYAIREAASAEDLSRAQALRGLAFRKAAGGIDADRFDDRCRHVLIEDCASGRLVATFRILPLTSGAEISLSYSAQHYELSALSSYSGPMIELGRFCLHPDWHDADILRLAWAEITRFVDADGAGMLFGCTSFRGTDTEVYFDSFAVLHEGHLAPPQWRPTVKAAKVFRFGGRPAIGQADRRHGLATMPGLLRTYLAMGGWVSDHAVVDAEFDTLHVFTGLEVRLIPAARAQALRRLAG